MTEQEYESWISPVKGQTTQHLLVNVFLIIMFHQKDKTVMWEFCFNGKMYTETTKEIAGSPLKFSRFMIKLALHLC